MKQQSLTLHNITNTAYRAVIKTRHGRIIYLELRKEDDNYTITHCHYLDRTSRGKYYATPQKLHTRQFHQGELLNVIATELDRRYFGITITDSLSELSTENFIKYKLDEMKRGYKFLIFIGEGDAINGIPAILRTRFKNRIHRSIYLELRYHKDKGVVADCHYFDRNYKSRRKVIAPMLSSVFFKYSRDVILNMVNSELNTDFTDIIFVTDNSIDITKPIPLCGNI